MYYPIGDIHGFHGLAVGIYELILEDIASEDNVDDVNTIVFLGDYIDRGPESKQVLDFVMGLRDTDTLKHIILRGNHEEFMINAVTAPDDVMGLRAWLSYGGEDTLKSFGVSPDAISDGVLDEYVDWCSKLPVIAQDDDYIFVHAGVHEYAPLYRQPKESCLWDIDATPDIYKNLSKVVVHGHISIDDAPRIDLPNNRIWMDCGTYNTKRICSIRLPEPFDYEYENRDGYTVLEFFL